MRIYAILILAFCLLGCAPAQRQGQSHPPPLTDEGREMAPRELVLSGANVFAQGQRAHDLMKDVLVVVKMLNPTEAPDLVFQAQFIAGQKIEWAPVRSSRPAEYEFRGNWQVKEDGTLTIYGKYELTDGAIARRTEREGHCRFLVPAVLLRRGYPPYTHTVELWIKQANMKASDKPDAGDGK